MLGWQAAAGLDWARLRHAYGPAEDTPGHLRALIEGDLAAAEHGLGELSFSVVHQYSVYPAAAPTVRVLGGLLADPALRRHGVDQMTLLEGVLALLDEVAYGVAAYDGPQTTELTWEIVTSSEADGDALAPRWEWSMADLLEACAELVDAVTPLLSDPEADVRLAAAQLLTRLGQVPAVSDRRHALISLLAGRLKEAKGRDERATLVAGIGELGGDTGPWLDDADEAVRASAAMSRHTDPVATAVLCSVLLRPEEPKRWFATSPWPYTGTRPALIAELLSRDLTFADLLPVALAVVEDTSTWAGFPEFGWGLFLRRGFPTAQFVDGAPPSPPTVLDQSQRVFLEALLQNGAIWNPANGNCRSALMRAGIPTERRELERLLRRTRRRGPRYLFGT